jgi:lipoprotein NlpI
LVYTTLGEYGKAIQDFTMIIQLSPNDPDAYNQRGLAFHKNKEYDKALNDFETALKLNALYAEAHYNKGLALLSKGDVKEAQKSFQNAKAMGYRPKNGIVKQASK